MIVVRRTENAEENKTIDEMLRKYNIISNKNVNNIYFVMEDNDTIVGGCSIMINNGYAVVDFLIIEESRRREKLGDGLLKAVFNYCLRNGINKAYFVGDNHYLIKKGFNKVDKDVKELALTTTIGSDSLLECDIEEFFKKGCSSCRRS